MNLGEVNKRNAVRGTRDASHVATVCVTAQSDFNPGEHVDINSYSEAVHSPSPVGIIDPFLKKPVKKGDTCLVLIYPNTVLNLRHHWDHPSLPSINDQEDGDDSACNGC